MAHSTDNSMLQRGLINSRQWLLLTGVCLGLLVTGCGGQIAHQGILQPGTDPHVYEPTPRDSVALENADLILYNGFNLEPGLIKMINSTGVTATKFAVGEVVEPLNFEYEGQKEPDPHVWGDAENAIAMTEAIRDRLSELSPEDEAEFTANAEEIFKGIPELWPSPCPGAPSTMGL